MLSRLFGLLGMLGCLVGTGGVALDCGGCGAGVPPASYFKAAETAAPQRGVTPGAGDVAGEKPPENASAIRFNKNFEGGSLGKIESLGSDAYRCWVEGQYDERGHNRQTSWFYFRLDGAKGREVTITLSDFVGEYNDKPGACPMGPDIVPVYSDDGRHWSHFDDSAVKWDGEKKEVTLKFTPSGESIWIAHIPPYTPRDLQRLLDEIKVTARARIEVIGKTIQGRDLNLITVTDQEIADAGKKVVWLQARQHAWEAGTSHVMEGALQFIASDDPAAKELCRKTIFKFTPMVDVDGCAGGKVRFNGNGFDVNRHWLEVDLRRKEFLERMPEIWYTKKAIVNAGRIDLLLNLHNTETNEYLDTMVDDPAILKRMQRLSDILTERTSFDPSSKLATKKVPADTTNSLYVDHKIPAMLMEQRIATSKKLGRRPTVADRLEFGKQLISAMAEAVGD